MEKYVDAELYRGYYLAPTLQRREGGFLDTFVVSAHQPGTHEQALISAHSRGSAEARRHAEKGDARAAALEMARAWVDQHAK